MTRDAETLDIEGQKGITRLNAAPVKKQPNRATVRLRFQFMGASEGDIAFRSVARCLRYRLNISKQANYAHGR